MEVIRRDRERKQLNSKACTTSIEFIVDPRLKLVIGLTGKFVISH